MHSLVGGARVDSKQGKEKVNLVERESENKGKGNHRKRETRKAIIIEKER